MHNLRTLFLLLFFGILAGCSTTLTTERPPEYYEKAEYVPSDSYVTLPFQIEISKLERTVNSEFRGLIYSDTSFEDNDHDNLMVKAWKTGDLHLTANGNQLAYSVPLHVAIKKRIVIGPSFLNMTDTREIQSDLVLKFRTRLALEPDWTVSFTTFSDGYEWLSTPTVKIGSLDIPLPGISDMLLSSNQQDINKGIDKALREYFDLRPVMQKIWHDLQIPERISEDYPVWARITPMELRAIPLTSAQGILSFTAGVRARAELFYGDEPPYRLIDSLPDLKITSRLDNDFNLNLALEVPFTHLNSLARQELIDYRMTEGKYTVVVKDVDLYGNGENLVVALKVEGSIRGTIYLAGKPEYDPGTKSLVVAGLDFDIRTKNVLMKSASWIFHHGLVKTLSSKMVFPVGQQLEQIRQSVQSYLSPGTKMDYFTLTGTLDKVEIRDIMIAKSSVKAVFNISGKLQVNLN